MATTTYWHIGHPSYAGGDLQCRNNLGPDAPAWAWGEDADEGFDGDVVCLFADTPDGRRDADWSWYERPDFALLRVDLPDDVTITRVEEGYPAVIDHIPAEYITEIRRDYAENVIGADTIPTV